VHLRPRSAWRAGMTLDALRAEMSRAVQMPGVSNIWTMPIINRIDMLTTGIRSEVGIKIFGNDLAQLEDAARRVSDVVRTVPGASNVYPEQVTSGQYLNIEIDRGAAARYGLTVGAVQQVIEAAIGETPLTSTIEGRQRFQVRVRYAPRYRGDPEVLRQVLVASATGTQIPLGEVAHIAHARGPAMISSENGLLLATVLLNVQNRDVGGFVRDAQQRVAREVSLPAGYYLGWSGRWENEAHARERLQIVLPIVLLVIFVLLYFTYHSALEAAHVLLTVPFALTGGVYLLWALGYNFSVAVWVGFIALFGTAVQTGVVMVIYLQEAVARTQQEIDGPMTRSALRQAVIDGALLRLRPKLMTVSTVIAGLLPLMWSQRVGAEVMKPLATPVLGGMVSSLLHVLIVTPVIFFWIRERQLGLTHEPLPTSEWHFSRRGVLIGGGVVVIAIATLVVWRSAVAPRDDVSNEGAATVVQTVRSGNLEIAVLSPTGTLRQGRNSFTIEFRRGGTKTLVDVGTVHATANMAMPGMVMPGGLQVKQTGVPGRYAATAEFGMAGGWQMSIAWNGPAGQGSVNFTGGVQ
jgi:copper/silver efflux system protein